MNWIDMPLELADHMTVGDVVAILQWELNEQQLEEIADELCAFRRNSESGVDHFDCEW